MPELEKVIAEALEEYESVTPWTPEKHAPSHEDFAAVAAKAIRQYVAENFQHREWEAHALDQDGGRPCLSTLRRLDLLPQEQTK